MSASMLAFRGLFGYQPDGSIGPACAESCEVSDDGLTYTVKLRDGLKWSDGSALGAIGITVELQEDDWSAFSNPDRTDYDLIRGGYISDTNDPEELLRLMTTTGANRCHFGDDPSATPTPTDTVEEHTHQIELKNAKDATCTRGQIVTFLYRDMA